MVDHKAGGLSWGGIPWQISKKVDVTIPENVSVGQAMWVQVSKSGVGNWGAWFIVGGQVPIWSSNPNPCDM